MRLVLGGALAVAAAGCELVFPVHGGHATDAPVADDDAAPADAGPPDAMLGLWVLPQAVSFDVTAPAGGYLTDPSLTRDETELAYVSIGPTANSAQILIAETSGDPLVWGSTVTPPFSVAAQNETNPKFRPDGLRMWMAAYADAMLPDIRAWKRDNEGSNAWVDTTAGDASGLNTPDDERPGTPTADGEHMIIHRKTGAVPDGELIEYARVASGPWQEVPGTLAAVNALGPTNNAHLLSGGRTLVFAAQVAGQADLYITSRVAVGTAFATPVPLDGVNDPLLNDSDPWLSADGRRLWFSRTTPDNMVSQEWGIYYTERAAL